LGKRKALTLEELIARTTARTVKSVKVQRYKHHDVVAIAGDQILFESGELISTEKFIETFPELPRLVLVGRGVADFIAILDERYGKDQSWQWRVTAKERDILPSDQIPAAQVIQVSTVVNYFGWGFGLRAGKTYHLALDPIVFYGESFDTVWNIERSIIEELLAWGIAVRDFCHDNNLGIRPTSGGVSAQFLADPRFYPEDRRKVPRSINERARENLPGNHYQLFVPVDPSREYQAYYLDQHAAHHYHAELTRFPNANSLYAFGRFQNLGAIVFPTTWPEFSGLYYLRLGIPKDATVREYSPLIHKLWEESFDAFVWSSEIQYVKDLGYRIDGVIAAWGSREVDAGIPKYAKWAQGELERYSNASWLKRILLSTYGVLATKPRQREVIYKRTKKNKDSVATFTGKNVLHGLLVGATAKDKRIEPGIVNVLHRGLIEAATRVESLGYAYYLASQGYKILHIYADGVIIEDEGDTPLPILPKPWRLQKHLHHYKPINLQAFISSEVNKLPGGIHAYGAVELKPFFKSHRNRPYFTPEEIQWKRMYG